MLENLRMPTLISDPVDKPNNSPPLFNYPQVNQVSEPRTLGPTSLKRLSIRYDVNPLF